MYLMLGICIFPILFPLSYKQNITYFVFVFVFYLRLSTSTKLLVYFFSVLPLSFLSLDFLQTTLLSNFWSLLLNSVTFLLAYLMVKAFVALNLLLITALSGPIALLCSMLITAMFEISNSYILVSFLTEEVFRRESLYFHRVESFCWL